MSLAVDPAALRPAVTWSDGRLEVIDQTLLPERYEIRVLMSEEEVIDAIRRLVVRGAPAIGVCAAYGLVVGLDEAAPGDLEAARRKLDDLARRIGGARPTAVNLSWAVTRVRRAAEAGGSVEDVRDRALAEAEAIAREDAEACRLIGEYGRAELVGSSRLLTHCNTGRLATAGWGTALGVAYAKAAAGDPVEVLACETRPLLQGARLTAWELIEAGIPVRVLPDGAAAGALVGGMADAVVVGADRIAANGDVANKVGTLSHALAARAAGIPFYVAAPMSTFDLDTASGGDIVIEERAPEEVQSWRGVTATPPDVGVWNPAFDVTPHELVTGFITDRGVLRSPYSRSIADACREAAGR